MADVLQGVCDFCARPADADLEECVNISCSYADRGCDTIIYHRACLEKYQGTYRQTEQNRKHCFMCPRGKGKGSSVACRGKVNNYHIVHVKKNKPAVLAAAASANGATAKAAAPAKGKGAGAPAASAKSAKEQRPALGGTGAGGLRKLAQPKQNPALLAQPHIPLAQQTGPLGARGAAAVLGTLDNDADDSGDFDDAASMAFSVASTMRTQDLPVGFTPELSKAQLKNLRRREKKKAEAGGGEGCKEEGASGSGSSGGVVAAGAAAAGAVGQGAAAGGGAAASSRSSITSETSAAASAGGLGAAQPAPEEIIGAGAYVSTLDRYNQLLKQHGGLSSSESDNESEGEEEGNVGAAGDLHEPQTLHLQPQTPQPLQPVQPLLQQSMGAGDAPATALHHGAAAAAVPAGTVGDAAAAGVELTSSELWPEQTQPPAAAAAAAAAVHASALSTTAWPQQQQQQLHQHQQPPQYQQYQQPPQYQQQVPSWQAPPCLAALPPHLVLAPSSGAQASSGADYHPPSGPAAMLHPALSQGPLQSVAAPPVPGYVAATAGAALYAAPAAAAGVVMQAEEEEDDDLDDLVALCLGK